MWRTIVVLLCCTYCLAQREAVPDVSSSDVLPGQEADVPAEKADDQVVEDLWGEEKGEDYSYDDWSDFEEEAATREEADTQEQEEVAKQVVEKQVSPVPSYADEEGGPENIREGIERVDYMQPWSSTPVPSLWGSNSDVAEEPSDVMGDMDDWSGKYLTSDELFDGEAGDYSSESKEDPAYPADLGEYEDIENWPGLDSEVDGEVEGEEDSDADSESDGKDVDSNEYIKPTPTSAAEEYGSVVEGRKRGVFTVWHYAIFAIAGAIFILGLLVIVGAAIRSVRQPTSDYRRLADPTKV